MRSWIAATILLFYSLSKSTSIVPSNQVDSNRPLRGASVRSSPVIPSQFTSSQRSLPAIKIDPSGKVYTTQILKQQLANELGLPLRDLRIVDPSFPNQIQATFTARKKAILFCIENIKVVVQHNEALVFSPYQPEVQEFVPALQQQIQAAAGDLQGSNGPARFEHIVLEAALNVVCSNLFRRVRALSPAVASALNGLRAESRGLEVIQTQVDELLPLKNKIDELRKRVKEITRAITDTLNNDEDMAMMYLSPPEPEKQSMNKLDSQLSSRTETINTKSSKYESEEAEDDDETDGDNDDEAVVNAAKSAVGDSTASNRNDNIRRFTSKSKNNADASGCSLDLVDTMSLEMLFENYLNEVEWIASEVEEVIDEITNTEEYVVLQLDLLRNRILRFELTLSLSSFIVTCGALVTGLFGMNLLNHFETHSSLFYIVTVLMASGMIGSYISFKRYGRREKLF
jgi:Mg2+ and Co2+ transporter CorA